MPNTLNNPTTQLRIWQQNLNTSSDAQHCVISGPTTAHDWDIVAIQEPTIDARERPTTGMLYTPRTDIHTPKDREL